MSKRKSFLLHIDSLDILDDLTDEQAGQLFKAIKSHQKGEAYELPSIVKIAFSPFKNQFARDDEKYEKLCEKNRLIAEKRYSTKSTTGKGGNDPYRTVTKSTDNDSDSDSDSDSDNKSDSDSKNKITSRIEDAFNEIFWPAYHKKSNKAGALKSFKAALKREGIKEPNEFAEMLVNDCRERIKSNQLGFDNLHASTYLNNNRWEDEKQSEQVQEKFERPEWMRGIK